MPQVGNQYRMSVDATISTGSFKWFITGSTGNPNVTPDFIIDSTSTGQKMEFLATTSNLLNTEMYMVAIEDASTGDFDNLSFIQIEATDPYFSVSGSSGSMIWDGQSLEVRNAATEPVFSTAEDGVQIGSWIIETDRLQIGNNGMMLSGSGVISAYHFYVSEAGDITGSGFLFA